MNVLKSTSAVGPPPAPNAAGAKDNAELRKAAQDMEGVFIGHMLQAMRQTVPQSKLFGASSAEKMFQDMMDQQIAQDTARGGGFGLGEMLYQQLSQPASVKKSSEGTLP